MLATGLLVAKGAIHLIGALTVGYAGVLSGDMALYTIGRKVGRKALSHPRLSKLISPATLEKTSARFQRFGAGAVFAARFVAGTRIATFLSAGVLGVPFRRFILADGLAALITVPALVLFARASAEKLAHSPNMLAPVRTVILSAVGVIVAVLLLRWAWQRFQARRKSRAGGLGTVSPAANAPIVPVGQSAVEGAIVANLPKLKDAPP